ncbi:MAG: aldehyde ferredoxin oxidoreductase family protein [Chloroflexi bacterium]|nr:aldehyde ferredoxin oxidoreductase family protein [Chloroflexota bacterium]
MALTATVNLSNGAIDYVQTDARTLERFLGGRGLGAKILFDRVGPAVQPFDPDNCLIFSTGRFSGSPWPTASRYHVTFKSPATGAYGYANAGGHFGPELARAGFNAIVVIGKAASPVYLSVVDQAIVIRPADSLWGQETTAVQSVLLGPQGKNGQNGRVLCIGLAGENRVRMAAIVNDYGRAAARGGPGAVMGSKRLKAIHVQANQRHVTSAGFAEIARQMSRRLIEDPNTKGLRTYGTLGLIRPKNLSGDLPAKNHQLCQVPFIDDVDAKAFAPYKAKRQGCATCSIRCSRLSVVATGPHASEVEGPEYETTDALGPMCWNHDPEVVIRANQLCNEYGLDTISTGVTIAFAMECHERGLLSVPDLTLDWGDGETIVDLIQRIARREGIGDLLAEGVKRAADAIGNGADACAMHVKGLEIPRQEPRFSKGFGLGHATSNRGADHLYGLPTIDVAGNWQAARRIFPSEIVDQVMDTADESFKPDLLIYGEHYCAVTDSLGICKFSTTEEYSLFPADLAQGLAPLGVELSGDELLEIGERIVNLERLYNAREGLSRKDDCLPRRFTQEPLSLLENELEPSSQRTRLGRQIRVGRIVDFNAMLDRYYDLRGWDAELGLPQPETLERLGLADEGRWVAGACESNKAQQARAGVSRAEPYKGPVEKRP